MDENVPMGRVTIAHLRAELEGKEKCLLAAETEILALRAELERMTARAVKAEDDALENLKQTLRAGNERRQAEAELEQVKRERDRISTALEMTGCKTAEDLIDMANVGQSLLERIEQLTKGPGPFHGWTPADDPAEIVFDLINHYEDRAKLAHPSPEGELRTDALAAAIKAYGDEPIDMAKDTDEEYERVLAVAIKAYLAALSSSQEGGK